jgi:hypothetical protein
VGLVFRNLVTNVATADATVTDNQMTAVIHDDLAANTSAQARAGAATPTPTSPSTMTPALPPARKARPPRPGHHAPNGARPPS